VDRWRSAAVAWWLGAVGTGAAGWMLWAVSDRAGDDRTGLLLLALALGGVVAGGWLLAGAGRVVRRASLVLSAVWLAGAALVYPRLDFPADRLWASGLPALVALATAVLLAAPAHRGYRGGAARTAR
jgi:hypothetical protein